MPTQDRFTAAGPPPGEVGQPRPRTDSAAKVTGSARFTADVGADALAHAVVVGSPVAHGTLRGVDARAARGVPGVLAVLTPDDLPPLRPVGEELRVGGVLGESPLPHFRPDIVYAGQFLVLVVADTLEAAQQAASLVKLDVQAQPPELSMDGAAEVPEQMMGEPEVRRGDVQAAHPEVSVQATYTTPVEHHHPIEPCATLAEWHGDDLLLHDAGRWVDGAQAATADMLGLPRNRVRVISEFVGGAFGSKAFLWTHLAAAALAARAVQRPVRLVLSRGQMSVAAGHRPQTRQQLQLGASHAGQLSMARHQVLSETSMVCDMTEPCGRLTPELYACEHVEVTHRRVRRHVTSPNPMRAPGEAAGSFALECALDELAEQLKLDPLELRRRNDAPVNPQDGKPYSGKHLEECYRLGAERFGWDRRPPEPGTLRDGHEHLGWGMATSAYPANRSQASARVRIGADGQVTLFCAVQEIGTGVSTILRQLAADVLRLHTAQVVFEWGDSRLPMTPTTGASQITATVGNAVVAAAHAAHAELVRRAVADVSSPLHGHPQEAVLSRGGQLQLATDPAVGEPYAALLARQVLPFVEVEANSRPGDEREQFSFSSFGAVFAEVAVDVPLGTVRVRRMVGVYDVGRVINPRTARSQLRGGLLMGLGMALTERTVYDQATGLPLNDNLAEYLLPTCADTPELDVSWLDRPDPHMGEVGARGLGEIGMVGAAAAIANAVYHATGRRVRELPIHAAQFLNDGLGA